MISIIFGIITSFIITFILIPVIIRVSEKNNELLDLPSKRDSHHFSIPTFGGIAIFLGLLFSSILWLQVSSQIQFLLVALLIVFITGLIDDLATLSPTKKLFGQLLAVFFVIFFSEYKITSMYGIFTIHSLSEFYSVLLTGFTIIVITNAYNLIDGLDGLAGSVGVFMSSCFGLLFFINNQIDLSILAFSLAGSLLAFLKFNFHPARIFMGDTGSMAVGFLLAVFAINLVESNIVYKNFDFEAKGSALAIAILIVPLFDALRIFILRVFNSKNPFVADRNHLHHNLSDLGYGHRRTTLYITIVNLFFVILVFLVHRLGVNYILLIILSIAILLSQVPLWIKRNKK